ncbi:hypothetical protein NE169_18425 [Clostridium botulinum]|uniref:hypothetical protein n=1 Tax=Clostridium botulinum TaxID=1491 RepID=UPI00214813E2|nr:hypothetical protein [Clostridium botulinum]MCR1167293.1 hypothetical protein [Clostridium botulinum]
MDINKIAKTMTRKEFLKELDFCNNGKNVQGGYFFEEEVITCPCDLNLEEKCVPDSECYDCWENAIKDIKFKGENDMEFNWDGFTKGKVAVFCKNTKLKKDFLQKCTDIGLTCYHGSTKPINHCTSYDNIPYCYAYDTPLTSDLAYDKIEYFIKNNYEIIKWEIEKGENRMDIDITPAAKKAENMLNDLTTNKYDREYNILEFMEFEEGTEFTLDNRYICKVEDEYLKIKDGTGSWIIEHLAKEIIKAKFKLVKKDKKVSFEEAMESYNKDIYCIWIDAADMKHKSEYKIYSNESILKDQNEDPIAPVEIFEGEWYIKED